MPFFSNPLSKTSKSREPAAALRGPPEIVKSNYTSKDVKIPLDLLTKKADDAQPIKVSRIDFAKTKLPEYAGCYAIVLDNVLSASECAQLLKLVAESAFPDEAGNPWKPAMINFGGGYEVMAADYRNSDRIIWDNQDVVDRVFERCLEAEGLKDDLKVIDKNPYMMGELAAQSQVWDLVKPNERMRFLRYSKGHFFQRHCDSSYENPDPSKNERTHYTLHLYLNGEGIKGGQTRFFSPDEKRHLDVEAVTGRVLIFQHRRLLHSGEEVKGGEKYTMRTDLMYRLRTESD